MIPPNLVDEILDDDDGPAMKVNLPPPRPYMWLPTGDARDIAIAVYRRPNIFNRILQRLFFGFRYIKM